MNDDGEHRAQPGIELAPGNVLFQHALVDHRALLEKKHPRRDRGADVGHQEEEQLAVETAGKVRDEPVVDDLMHRRVDHEGARYVDEVERTEQQRDLFPGPVAPVQNDGSQQQDHGDHGQPARYAEDLQRRGHADELRDQGHPVDDHQVDQGKPAPERAETAENGLGMAPLGDGAQAHGHLLHVIRHGDEQDQEPDKVVTVLGAGGRIGGDAAGIVVGHHHDDARPGDDQIELDRLCPLAQAVIELGKDIHRGKDSGPVLQGSARSGAGE